MLKYGAVVLLMSFAVLVKSTPTVSPVEQEPEPLNVAGFRDVMKNLQGSAFNAAGQISGVLEHAVKAMEDPTGKSWEGFEDNFKTMLEQVGQTFDRETESMKDVIGRLWENPGDFVREPLCDSIVSLDARKGEVKEGLEFEFIAALMADLGCFKELFTASEHIPVDAMVGGKFSENDAVQVIQGVFHSMFNIKQAGDAFGNALESIDQEFNRRNSGSQSKRQLKRVLALLKKLSKRK